LLQGIAAVIAKQKSWICASNTLHPSQSKHFKPQQTNGHKHGAPHLKQHSQDRQHKPTLPDYPKMKREKNRERTKRNEVKEHLGVRSIMSVYVSTNKHQQNKKLKKLKLLTHPGQSHPV
jgi:hypothetical protein